MDLDDFKYPGYTREFFSLFWKTQIRSKSKNEPKSSFVPLLRRVGLLQYNQPIKEKEKSAAKVKNVFKKRFLSCL